MASTIVSAKSFDTALKEISQNIVWKNQYTANSYEDGGYAYLVDTYLIAAKKLMSKYAVDTIISTLEEYEDVSVDKMREELSNLGMALSYVEAYITMHNYIEHNAYYRMLYGLPSEEDYDNSCVFPDGFYNTDHQIMQHCEWPIDTYNPTDELVIISRDESDDESYYIIENDGTTFTVNGEPCREVNDTIIQQAMVEDNQMGNPRYPTGMYLFIRNRNDLYVANDVVEIPDGYNQVYLPAATHKFEMVKPVLIPVHEWDYYDRATFIKSDWYTNFAKEHYGEFDFEYLKYMAARQIYPFVSRMADRFALLYCPSSNPTILAEQFRQSYESCRQYCVRVFYTDAFRNSQGVYYEGFIGMAILFMTINQMYYKYIDADIDRDFYDLESLKIVYEAYGVPYIDTIPIKYHKKIVKKINKLLRYKGSGQVLIDLCDIFDYDIIGIYQYYLVKERKWTTNPNNDGETEIPYIAYKIKTDASGNTVYGPDGAPVLVYDYDKMYNYYFLKANILDNPESYLLDDSNLEDYDTIAVPDAYWFDEDDDTKERVTESDYNMIETKYMGVQIQFDMTELLYESCYFMRYILDNPEFMLREDLVVTHERISHQTNIFALVIYAFCLICRKNGLTGSIPSSPSAIARVLGFNIKGIYKALQETHLQGLKIMKDWTPHKHTSDETHYWSTDWSNDWNTTDADRQNRSQELDEFYQNNFSTITLPDGATIDYSVSDYRQFRPDEQKLLTKIFVEEGYGETAPSDGVVKKVTSDMANMVVEYSDGTEVTYSLQYIRPTEFTGDDGATTVTDVIHYFHTPYVAGDTVKAGDLLYYNDEHNYMWHGVIIVPNRDLSAWTSLVSQFMKFDNDDDSGNGNALDKFLQLIDKIDPNNVQSFSDLSESYNAMRDAMEILDGAVINSDSREEYNAWRQLQKICETTDMMESTYMIPDSDGYGYHVPATYDELLKYYDANLYIQLEEVSEDEEELKTETDYVLTLFERICADLEKIQYIDNIDINFITQYLYAMLRFFKSAKVDLIDFKMIFTIGSRSEGLIKLFDHMMDNAKVESNIFDNFAYWLYDDKFECLNDTDEHKAHMEKSLESSYRMGDAIAMTEWFYTAPWNYILTSDSQYVDTSYSEKIYYDPMDEVPKYPMNADDLFSENAGNGEEMLSD